MNKVTGNPPTSNNAIEIKRLLDAGFYNFLVPFVDRVAYRHSLKEIPLDKERLTIGRKPQNDIQIDNLAISGEHAVIVTILAVRGE